MTGPLYVHTEFEPIRTLLPEDVAGFTLWSIGPKKVGTVLVKDTKIYFQIGIWCSMKY